MNLKSILWKSGEKKRVFEKDVLNSLPVDLKLGRIMTLMSMEPAIKMTPEIFLESVTYDIDDILYRQNILKDFIKREDIRSKMEKLVSIINKMKELHRILEPDFLVPSVMLRLKKLEGYHSVMTWFEDIFSINELSDSSAEFKEISDEIKRMNTENKLSELKETIDKIKEITGKIKSIDIGANLTFQGVVSEAIVLSINSFHYEKGNLVTKLSALEDEDFKNSTIVPEISIKNEGPILSFQNEINKELEFLLRENIWEIKELLEPYKNIATSEIMNYLNEIFIYYGAVKLYYFMNESGYGCCFPKFQDEGACLKGIYNLIMAFEEKYGNAKDVCKVVKNDIDINSRDNLTLITGPNNGGKTVLLESLAVAQLLFQNGMMIPADEVCLPVYEHIFTHYHKDEDLSIGTGRLGEEAGRISKIIEKCQEDTLVLFNEPYVTTSPTEGLDILRLSVNKLISRKSRIYLVTHYLDILEDWDCNSGVASYVMEIKDGIRTFSAKNQMPQVFSYATDIAREFGVDEESITNMLNTALAVEVEKESV